MKILIVDDSPSSRAALTEAVAAGRLGEAIEAGDALEAFDRLGIGLGRLEPAVDVVLMDIVMPGIDGIEATRRIKADPAYRNVPVLVVSTLPEAYYLRQAFVAGATDYLLRPVDPAVLSARVESALAVRHSIEEHEERESALEARARALQDDVEGLRRQAGIDGVTGLPDRSRLEETLGREWARCLRMRTPLTVVLVGIDHACGDSQDPVDGPFADGSPTAEAAVGHETVALPRETDGSSNDAVESYLAQAARVLGTTIARAGDFLARHGESTFAVLLPGTEASGALHLAERMHDEVGRILAACGTCAALRVRCGLATILPEAPGGGDALMVRAERALAVSRNSASGIEAA